MRRAAHPRARRGHPRAMTLIEVLVAVVVCGAGLAVVAGGVAAAV
ncbi:MAG: type II secretion system protein, partial [Planctomycetes bacterium]|nr:type II secretion system protein [Planctomycetota bacterium]